MPDKAPSGAFLRTCHVVRCLGRSDFAHIVQVETKSRLHDLSWKIASDRFFHIACNFHHLTDIDPCLYPHLIKHIHEIFRADVARGLRCEWTTTNARQRSVVFINPLVSRQPRSPDRYHAYCGSEARYPSPVASWRSARISSRSVASPCPSYHPDRHQ